MSAFPSGTSAPYAAPTRHGSGGSILICHPVDGTPNNGAISAISSGSAPTSAPPVPTASAGVGSGGPIYICHPADSASAPSGSVPASDAPSFSLPSGTGAPRSRPTDGQGSGGSLYLQCSPASNDATGTPISSDPAPTSAPSNSASDA